MPAQAGIFFMLTSHAIPSNDLAHDSLAKSPTVTIQFKPSAIEYWVR